MTLWRFFPLIPLLLSMMPTPALAQDSDVIEIVVTGCAENEFARLQHLIEVEISSSIPEVTAWIREHRPILQIRCNYNRIEVQLENRDRTLINRVILDRSEAMARDMPRYAALAAVELMVPGSSSSENIPTARIEIVQQSFQALPSPRRRTDRWSIGALARAAGQPFIITFGGALHGEFSIPAKLSVATDFSVTTGRGEASLGQIQQTIWSGALALLSRHKVMNWSIRPGLGFRMGQVIWKGIPKNTDETISHKAYAPWGGPFVALLSSGRLSKRAELSFHIELGYTVFETGALVDNERELSVTGLWCGLFLGIGTYRQR